MKIPRTYLIFDIIICFRRASRYPSGFRSALPCYLLFGKDLEIYLAKLQKGHVVAKGEA